MNTTLTVASALAIATKAVANSTKASKAAVAAHAAAEAFMVKAEAENFPEHAKKEAYAAVLHAEECTAAAGAANEIATQCMNDLRIVISHFLS